jgi:Leucine-rich repeat (LRR) protein
MKRRVNVLIAIGVLLLSVLVGCSETYSNNEERLDDPALAKNDIEQGDLIPSLTSSEQDKSSIVSITIKGTEYSTNLKSLDLEHMQLTGTDIEPLAYMTDLTWLNLENNQISDISALTKLTKLSYLSLSGNQISDISALEGLTELWFLNLSRNQISDVSALAGKMKLCELWLDYNQISDVSALVGLKKLSSLYLRYNQIVDVNVIEHMAYVYSLNLEGNPFIGHVILNDMLMIYSGSGGDVIIPDGVKNISSEAFWGRTDITGIFIPDSVESVIDERDFPYIFGAFAGCTGIINITVSEKNSTYSSQDGVLFNKEKTTLIKYPSGRSGGYIIPDGVKNISGDDYGINSPFDCDGLTSVLIPDSVEDICWAPFAGCSKLTEINVSPGNSSFSSQDGVLFNKDKTTIIAYPPGRSGGYIIPDGVTDLADHVFFNCKDLAYVGIPEGVSYLEYLVVDYIHTAFLNCINLIKVVVPRSVTKIDDEVFDDCPDITIHGYADSEAQRYAEEKHIPFIEIK